MSKKVFFLCLFISILISFALPLYAVETGVNAIQDVPVNHWAAEKIKLLIEKNG